MKFPVNWIQLQSRRSKQIFKMVAAAANIDFWLKPFQLLNLIYKSPKYFLPSFESTDILFWEKKFKIDFQDGHHGGHLGFFFFFDLGFTALSRIFHLYRADRSSKVGENRRTRRKTTWPSVSRTWLSHIWPERGSNHSGEKPNGLRVNSLIH